MNFLVIPEFSGIVETSTKAKTSSVARKKWYRMSQAKRAGAGLAGYDDKNNPKWKAPKFDFARAKAAGRNLVATRGAKGGKRKGFVYSTMTGDHDSYVRGHQTGHERALKYLKLAGEHRKSALAKRKGKHPDGMSHYGHNIHWAHGHRSIAARFASGEEGKRDPGTGRGGKARKAALKIVRPLP